MYDFKDKRTIDKYYSWKTKNFANKDYIPFSMIFTIVPFNTSELSTSILEAVNKYTTLKNKPTLTMIKEVEKRLREWLDQVPVHMPWYRQSSRESLSKLYSLLTENLHFRYIMFRGSYIGYSRGYYTLLTEDADRSYFMLVIKREYLRYVKLCILLNEPIMEDCYEFWYDEKFIESTTESIRIKRVLNKILKDLKSMDIPCINKENMLDLFKVGFDFKAPTISAQKERINQFVEDYQTHEILSQLGGKTS